MRETSFFVAQTQPFQSQESEKNVYEDSSAEIKGEAERLRSLTYPSLISEELLGPDLQDRIIVDLGAGSNTDLYDFSVNVGATYVPVDIHKDFLHVHREGGGVPIVADIDNLPFVDNSVNITHARFVLSWLADPSKRLQSIHECMRVCRERSLFLEYDWTSMDGSGRVVEFKDLALEILMANGFDPYYGRKLAAEVESEASFPHTLHISRNNEGTVTDPEEFIKMGAPLAHMARTRMDRPDLADTISACVADLASHEVSFIRPDIVGVEVRKETAR